MFQNLSWRDLNYEIKKKPILTQVSGEVSRGRLCAIMGPSGSGKTSLLNILSGRNRDIGIYAGSIYVNGIQIDPRKFRTNIAYVMQDDALFGTQTPREAITFSATLRLPPSTTQKQRTAIVNEVICTLGLESCADTYIGTKFIKGISGGEKKRTSIATELVSDPSILVLDEPTSGLDSYSAYNVVKTLQNLSASGKTIVTTIHQPSSEVFALFDDVILLANGRMIYKGPRDEITAHFQYNGYTCGPNMNPADFVMFKIQNPEIAERLMDSYRSHYFSNSQLQLRVDTDAVWNNRDNHQDIFITNSFSDTSTEIDEENGDYDNYVNDYDYDPDNHHLHDNTHQKVSITNLLNEPQPIMRQKNRRGKKFFTFSHRGFLDRICKKKTMVDDVIFPSSEHTYQYRYEDSLIKERNEHKHEHKHVHKNEHKDEHEHVHEHNDGYKQIWNDNVYSKPNRSSCCIQWRELVKREYMGVWRDKMALVARFGSTIFLNAVIGMVFYGSARWDTSVNDKPITYTYMTEWIQNHFGALVQVGIGGMFAISQPVVLTFPQERPIFLREYALGMYSSVPYFVSKVMIEIPMAFLQSCVIFLTTYYLIGFQGEFIYLVSTLTLFGLCASSISMIIGSVSSNVEVAFQLVPLLTVPQLLFSGFFISINKIPEFIRWLQYVCALKYGINLLMISEFETIPDGFPSNQTKLYNEFVIGCPEPVSITEFYCPNNVTPDTHALFPKNNVETNHEWIYVGILGGVFTLLRVVSCIILSSKAYFS